MTLAAAPPRDVAPAPRTSSEAFRPQPEHLDCPNCGSDVTPLCVDAIARAQSQLSDLEAQVRLLNQKATAAVDKWADYEDELHTLRQQLSESANRSKASTPTPAPPTTTSRFSFLSPRKAPSSLPTPQHSPHQSTSTSTSSTSLSPNTALLPSTLSSGPPPPPEKDPPKYPTPLDLASAETAQLSQKLSVLESSLRHETELRKAAEEKALAGGRELEELTAQLFEEANRMVAVERREKARLEERMRVLESREEGRREGLRVLEGAVRRIERVRVLVGEQEVEGERVVVKKGRVIGRKSVGGEGEEGSGKSE